VNTKTKGAYEIANGVLSRAFEDKYGSKIDILVARSLDEFAHYSTTLYGERPFLVKKKFEYICSKENFIGVNNFTLKVNTK